MFLGTHAPRLDEKGRLILPARFREELAGGVILTRGQERCLYVFTTAEFERMYAQLREAPLAQRQARDYVRVMLSGADPQIPDRQGRIQKRSWLEVLLHKARTTKINPENHQKMKKTKHGS